MTNKKPSLAANGFDERISYETVKFNDKELLEIFPEAREIIPLKILEYEVEREEFIEKVRAFQEKVKEIARNEKKDEFFVWFWAVAYVKYFHAPRLAEIDHNLFRLRRQNKLLIGNTAYSNRLENWKERVAQAKEVSVIEIAEHYLQKIRQTSSRVSALCPFHQEKTPSFFIFINSNNFKCFGCGASGDSITFLMKIENLSFVEAVRRLVV